MKTNFHPNHTTLQLLYSFIFTLYFFKTMSSKDDCSICYKDITNDPAKLDGCQHTYCEDCIKRWAERENSCPNCRAKFHTITINQNIFSVENRRQIEDLIDEEYDYEEEDDSLEEILSPYEIGTIIKRRNTNIKHRYKYIVKKRYMITNDMDTTLMYHIIMNGDKVKNIEGIYDIQSCFFTNRYMTISRLLNDLIWMDDIMRFGYTNLHCLSTVANNNKFSIPMRFDWFTAGAQPDWALFCGQTLDHIIQRNIIEFYTKKELKIHIEEMKHTANKSQKTKDMRHYRPLHYTSVVVSK